jgi:hypothetical protein
VIGPLPTAVVIGGLVLAVVALVYAALNRIPDWGLLGVSGLVVAATVVVLVAATFQVVTGRDPDLVGEEVATALGYLLTAVLIVPIGFAWALGERSRGSMAAFALVCLTHAFLVVRAMQVWGLWG